MAIYKFDGINNSLPTTITTGSGLTYNLGNTLITKTSFLFPLATTTLSLWWWRRSNNSLSSTSWVPLLLPWLRARRCEVSAFSTVVTGACIASVTRLRSCCSHSPIAWLRRLEVHPLHRPQCAPFAVALLPVLLSLLKFSSLSDRAPKKKPFP